MEVLLYSLGSAKFFLWSIFLPPSKYIQVRSSVKPKLSSVVAMKIYFLTFIFWFQELQTYFNLHISVSECSTPPSLTGGAHCSKLILISSVSACSWPICSCFCPAGCCCYRTSLLAWCWLGGLSLVISDSDHLLCRQIDRLERKRGRKGNERLPHQSVVCAILLLQKGPSWKGIPQNYVSDHVYVCVPFCDKNNGHFRVKTSWLGLGTDVLWFG